MVAVLESPRPSEQAEPVVGMFMPAAVVGTTVHDAEVAAGVAAQTHGTSSRSIASVARALSTTVVLRRFWPGSFEYRFLFKILCTVTSCPPAGSATLMKEWSLFLPAGARRPFCAAVSTFAGVPDAEFSEALSAAADVEAVPDGKVCGGASSPGRDIGILLSRLPSPHRKLEGAAGKGSRGSSSPAWKYPWIAPSCEDSEAPALRRKGCSAASDVARAKRSTLGCVIHSHAMVL